MFLVSAAAVEGCRHGQAPPSSPATDAPRDSHAWNNELRARVPGERAALRRRCGDLPEPQWITCACPELCSWRLPPLPAGTAKMIVSWPPFLQIEITTGGGVEACGAAPEKMRPCGA